MKRQDWLLIFLGMPGGHFAPDQIRIMKGLFLWSQEGPPTLSALYNFEPYQYGPFDTGVYRDLDELEGAGLVHVEQQLGTSQRLYRLTPQGKIRSAQLSRELSADTAQKLAGIKLLVTSLSFSALLKHVYERYPAYAARSVARV